MPTPTVKPNPSFNAEKAAQDLRDAMKGLGTDEKKIIATLSTITSKQRVECIPKFKVMFGKDLISDLKSELGGNLENVVLECMMDDAERDATALRKAMKGAGTDEETLIDILATRSNSEIAAIKSVYTTKFKRDLEKDLKSETSGHFERLLVGLVQGARNEGKADPAKAAADAKALQEAGEKKWGTDESTFQRIIVTSSPAQLHAINEEYKKISKYDLVHIIEKEMSGSVAKGFRAVVLAAIDPYTYFAERLYDSMAGAGTNDDLLIRLVVSRAERDLEDIKGAFRTKYGKTLEAMIKGDCSGDYKKMLLALCGDH